MISMNPEALRAFYELAQSMNFRKTSEKLFVSQSTLTRWITALEKEFGFKLFVRTTRSVKLTKRGQFLLVDVKNYLDCVDLLSEHVRTLSGDSPLTLAYMGRHSLKYCSMIFNEWIARYPDCRINIVSIPPEKMIKMLQSGEIDAFITLLSTVSVIEGIDYVHLEKRRLDVILPADHTLALNESISLEDIRRCGRVLLPDGPNTIANSEIAKLCAAWGIETSAFVELESLPYHVSCGEGIGLKPNFLNYDNSALFGTVQIPLLAETNIFDRVFAYSRENENPMLAKILEIVDCCIEKKSFLPDNCIK